MQVRRSCFLLGALTLAVLAFTHSPASAATAAITNYVQVNNSIGFSISVTLTSSQSECMYVRHYCTKLGGGGPTPQDVANEFWGAGSQTDGGYQFDNLASGSYDCYGIAHGWDTSSFPWQEFTAASDHHNATV